MTKNLLSQGEYQITLLFHQLMFSKAFSKIQKIVKNNDLQIKYYHFFLSIGNVPQITQKFISVL